MTKIGIRISFGTYSRIRDIVVFDATSTNKVANPKPIALVTVAVTASRGQRPNTCTKPGLFFHNP